MDIPDWTLQIAQALMAKVREKDAETYHHCVRVSRGTRLLARTAGLDLIEQKQAEFAGLFHDIGKIHVPENILLKPSKLTPEEMAVMKDHPDLSVELLKPLAAVDFFKALMPGVRFHHEWFDGRGYPRGLKAESIPLTARLVLIADTFDAMTADRVYRKGRPAEVAYKELHDFAGTQFDPDLVKIYLEAHPHWDERGDKAFADMNATVLVEQLSPIKSAA